MGKKKYNRKVVTVNKEEKDKNIQLNLFDMLNEERTNRTRIYPNLIKGRIFSVKIWAGLE